VWGNKYEENKERWKKRWDGNCAVVEENIKDGPRK
jgi:hypothetical protein